MKPIDNEQILARLEQQWLVACASRELRQGKLLARTILEKPVVLFRTQNGTSAVIDSCSHRNAPLSAGWLSDDHVRCPYHGWEFDASGKCTTQPGTSCAKRDQLNIDSFETMECAGFVWIKLAPGECGRPSGFQNWENQEQYSQFLWISDVSANVLDAIENLLDATHTPFVHAGLVRSASSSQQFQATVQVTGEQVEVEYSGEGKQAGWVSKIFERDRASSFGRYVPPCLAELEYTSSRNTEFVLNSFFTPTTRGNVRVYSKIYLRNSMTPAFLKRLLLTPFFSRILKQDNHILRLQQENIQKHGAADYQYWEGDLLRGWIDHWFRNGCLPRDVRPQVVELDL